MQCYNTALKNSFHVSKHLLHIHSGKCFSLPVLCWITSKAAHWPLLNKLRQHVFTYKQNLTKEYNRKTNLKDTFARIQWNIVYKIKTSTFKWDKYFLSLVWAVKKKCALLSEHPLCILHVCMLHMQTRKRSCLFKYVIKQTS